MSGSVAGRINSIVHIHNPSIEVHRVEGGLNTGAAVILIAGGGHNTLNAVSYTHLDVYKRQTLYRKQGRVKYGFGLNGEQELTHLWRTFFRLGWNDGHTESFAYTEVDRTAEFGSDFRGSAWHLSLIHI